MTAFDEVMPAAEPEPRAIAAALADLVSSFVASFLEERREAKCERFFALVPRLTAQKLTRLQVAGEGEGEPAWRRPHRISCRRSGSA